MARPIKTEDQFKEKLLKLIPSEIIAAYLCIQGLLMAQPKQVIWIVMGVMFILTFLYLRQIEQVRKIDHLLFSTFSFLIWVYGIGTEEVLGGLYNPPLASLVLVLWTLFIPLVVKPGGGASAPAAPE